MSINNAQVPQPGKPWYRRRLALIPAGVLGLALLGGAAAGGATLAGPHTTVIRPAANTAPATPKATAHAHPARPAPASYSRHIASAGIACPPAKVDSIGPEVVSYWQAGYSVQWTNINILMVVGIYQFDTFNQITAQDFNVTLPAGGIAPASSQPPAPPVPATPPTQPAGPTQSADPAPQPAQPDAAGPARRSRPSRPTRRRPPRPTRPPPPQVRARSPLGGLAAASPTPRPCRRT